MESPAGVFTPQTFIFRFILLRINKISSCATKYYIRPCISICILTLFYSHPRTCPYRYRYSVTGNVRRPISALLLVLYVTTIRQTVCYTQRPFWLKIYAIRITLYPFPTRYNGFLPVFAIFQKNSNPIFSGTRAPFTKVEVVS